MLRECCLAFEGSGMSENATLVLLYFVSIAACFLTGMSIPENYIVMVAIGIFIATYGVIAQGVGAISIEYGSMKTNWGRAILVAFVIKVPQYIAEQAGRGFAA